MLSAATLSYLSPQEDVNEQQIDDLVKYAATVHPDAWKAILLMHEQGIDRLIDSYILRLGDAKLSELAPILPTLWRYCEAINQEKEKQQAAADLQPKALQQQANMQQMMDQVTRWMRDQSIEVCTSIICEAIDATAQADMVRCKQDWAGLKHLVCDEGQWVSDLTNEAFIQMLSDHCHFNKELMPSVSSLKVLVFGKSQFPAWKVNDYEPQKLNSLVQMGTFFLQAIVQKIPAASGMPLS